MKKPIKNLLPKDKKRALEILCDILNTYPQDRCKREKVEIQKQINKLKDKQ